VIFVNVPAAKLEAMLAEPLLQERFPVRQPLWPRGT
jgi:hypothetical protein